MNIKTNLYNNIEDKVMKRFLSSLIPITPKLSDLNVRIIIFSINASTAGHISEGTFAFNTVKIILLLYTVIENIF